MQQNLLAERSHHAPLGVSAKGHMTIAQLHESARGYAARQVDKGTLSIKLLAVKARISQPHASSFVHGRKRLSVASLSRVVSAIGFDAELFVRQPAAPPLPAPRAGTPRL